MPNAFVAPSSDRRAGFENRAAFDIGVFGQAAPWLRRTPDHDVRPALSVYRHVGLPVLNRRIAKVVGRCTSVAALGLIACLLFAKQSSAADNFIQLHIAAKGGCGGVVSPLSVLSSEEEIRMPFGKAAAEWSDDDLASLKTVLAACLVTSARRGNPYILNEYKRAADELLAKIPAIVGQAKDRALAQTQQIEARRQLAATRIDTAAQAKQQAKASAETEVARLEHEATMAEAAARDAQRRANAQIAQASRARDEAQAKVDAIASLVV